MSLHDEYSQQSENKSKISKSNKGYQWKYQSQYYSLQDHKQDIYFYSLLLFTVLMEGLGSKQERK